MMEGNKVGYSSHDRGEGIKTKEARPRFVLINERSVPLPKDCVLVLGLDFNNLKKQRDRFWQNFFLYLWTKSDDMDGPGR